MMEALYTGTCEGPLPQQWGMFWISSLGGVALSDVLRKPWLQPLRNHFLTVIYPDLSQVVLGGAPPLGQHLFHHQHQQYKFRGTEYDFKVWTSKAFIRLGSWIFLAIQFLKKQPLDLFASNPFLMLADTPKFLSDTQLSKLLLSLILLLLLVVIFLLQIQACLWTSWWLPERADLGGIITLSIWCLLWSWIPL